MRGAAPRTIYESSARRARRRSRRLFAAALAVLVLAAGGGTAALVVLAKDGGQVKAQRLGANGDGVDAFGRHGRAETLRLDLPAVLRQHYERRRPGVVDCAVDTIAEPGLFAATHLDGGEGGGARGRGRR